MDRKVTLSLRALVLGGLLIALGLWGAIEIVKLHAAFDNAKFTVQLQQAGQNIQALDQAYGALAKRVEDLERAK